MSITFDISQGSIDFTAGTLTFTLLNMDGSDAAATIIIRDPTENDYTYNSTINIPYTASATYTLAIADFLLSGGPMQYYASGNSTLRYRMTINGTETEYLTTVYASDLTAISATTGFTIYFGNLTPAIGYPINETTTSPGAILDVCGSTIALGGIVFTNDVAAPGSYAVTYASLTPPLTVGYGAVLPMTIFDAAASTVADGGSPGPAVPTFVRGSGTINVGPVSFDISNGTINFCTGVVDFSLINVVGAYATASVTVTQDSVDYLLNVPLDISGDASYAFAIADFLDASSNNPTSDPLGVYEITIQADGAPVTAPLAYEGGIPPCFLEGSRIRCIVDGAEVDRPIQELRRGDLIKTVKHGFKAVDAIGYSKLYNPANSSRGANRLYVCSKQAYSELTEDLVITGHHSILVEELTEAQAAGIKEQFGNFYVTNGYYRLPACVDERAIPLETEGLFTIWHLALDHEIYTYNYGIYANGLLVESCSKRYLKELSGMTLV
jgi:hypothetical protein